MNNNPTKLKKHNPILMILKVILYLVISVILALLIMIGGWNGLKYAAYKDYFSLTQELRNNPGLNDGYVTQGNCYHKESDMYLTSGYMTDNNQASRIYMINKNNEVNYTEIYNPGGSKCTYHFGGLAYYGNYFFVGSHNSLLVLDTEEVFCNETATIKYIIPVNNQASFVSIKGDSLYVGEFNDSNQYKTYHEMKIDDNTTYHAIISEYDLSTFKEDQKINLKSVMYIRDKVQGVAITDSGRIVLSTSWGASPSRFYVYSSKGYIRGTFEEENAPVYYLDDCVLETVIEGPAMAEDLDYYNGKVITSSEASSTKYLFGKLFFYNKIVGISIA